VVAKAMLTDPAILILDEPTRGIDIGAKSEIYAIISRLARDGKAIIMVSSELTEILALSHRILVICEGAVTAEQRDRLLRGRAEERPRRGRVERDRRDSVAGRRTGLAHPASHLVLGGDRRLHLEDAGVQRGTRRRGCGPTRRAAGATAPA
jgi:ABC-type multidrug transport system ATPase subunit